jgi:hypothetical protein
MTETRMIDCEICQGDTGWVVPGAERWERCEACDGTGEVEVTMQPINCDDLDAIPVLMPYVAPPVPRAGIAALILGIVAGCIGFILVLTAHVP